MGSHSWGVSEELIRNEQYVLKKLTVNSDEIIPWHFHRTKHESMICVEGRGRIELAPDGFSAADLLAYDEPVRRWFDFLPGRYVDVPLQTWHRVLAGEDISLVLMEPQGPNTDDIEWLVDA